MKYVEEYRDPEAARRYATSIARIVTRPWTIMEICGGQTHAIVKYGIDELLPKQVTLVHGPGCPVCVTPVELIDKALRIAAQPNIIFCSFGDMLRVPGSCPLPGAEAGVAHGSASGTSAPPGPAFAGGDLFGIKAAGGDVRIVYSPMDAVQIAKQNPDREVVFFAVGFETTAPANAMSVYYAKQHGVTNYSVLVSHVLVPPAMEAILSSPTNRVQGFLAAGHVCTVMGYNEYYPIAAKYSVPIVVTGFEPLDLLQGVYMCVLQLEQGRFEVENQYARSVRREGNTPAQQLVTKVFRVVDRKWRGIGGIPQSGWALAEDYAEFDAESRFGLSEYTAQEDAECISGLIMQGAKKPEECSAYAKRCTPDHPLGAPMVSSEGACAAYYRYRRLRTADLAHAGGGIRE
ncbi:MAG TPA: hydrogenase formation protein HypD [Candidatus Binatia bacterium]|nr:hydrogenase formation protein HypD [Candidatus Binatia bacterium]